MLDCNRDKDRKGEKGREVLRDCVIEGDEGARDDGDVHEVPEVSEVRARMKNEADVDHLQTKGNKLACLLYKQKAVSCRVCVRKILFSLFI